MDSDATFRARAGIIQQSCQQKIDPYVYVDSNSSGHAECSACPRRLLIVAPPRLRSWRVAMSHLSHF